MDYDIIIGWSGQQRPMSTGHRKLPQPRCTPLVQWWSHWTSLCQRQLDLQGGHSWVIYPIHTSYDYACSLYKVWKYNLWPQKRSQDLYGQTTVVGGQNDPTTYLRKKFLDSLPTALTNKIDWQASPDLAKLSKIVRTLQCIEENNALKDYYIKSSKKTH